MKLLQNLFGFERKETVGEILFYRLFELFLIFWVIKYAWRWGLYMLRLEDVVLPLGIANYIDVTFMFSNHLSIVNAVLISALVVAGYLRQSRYAYFVALLLLHLQYVARFSLGEISHGSNFVGIVLLAVSLATIVFEHPQEVRRAALGLAYFFFGLGYTMAASCKLIATGPHWVDGRHLWLWIDERTVDTFSTFGEINLNLLQQVALDHYPFATMILMFGLFTELLGFAMWFKRSRPYITTLLICMHLGILFIMKISFSSNLYLLILVAYPWARLIDGGLQKVGAARLDKVRQRSTHLA